MSGPRGREISEFVPYRRREASDGRKPYRRPALRVYGELKELTAGSRGSNFDSHGRPHATGPH